MFPVGPRQRQQMPPYSPYSLRRPIGRQQQPTAKPNLMAMFLDKDGNFDLEKMTVTAQQISKLYGQVSPMLSRFIKR